MQVLVQFEYKKIVSDVVSVHEATYSYSLDQKIFFKIILGDTQFFNKIISDQYDLSNVKHKILILNNNEKINAEIFSQISPTEVSISSDTQNIIENINKAFQAEKKNELTTQTRLSIESKRAELENLNEFLAYQDKERTTALKIFHSEELSKKQHEKQLLFFLDFINSNYTNSNFLDDLLKFLWIEIKKMGSFYQMGILTQFLGEEQAVLFQYDDRKYYSQKMIYFDQAKASDSNLFTNFLANLYQRPVSKVLLWQEAYSKVQFYIYLETQGKEFNSLDLDLFISERLSVLSLIISRWVTEKNEKTLLKQWRNTFKSYKDPIHVIDKDFNIIQANYENLSASNNKCYQVLAGRKAKCEMCPVSSADYENIKNQSKVTINQIEYKVHMTEFFVLKKHYLLFYENRTEINSLKSQIIQSEKMSTIGNLANHLAHELNNPLTGLKLNTEYLISELQNQKDTNQQAHLVSDLNEILKATIRSEVIIKDLVDFSDSGSQQIQEIDFALVLKKTMTLLKSVLRNNRIFIDVKSHLIFAQPVYLQQVLFNLIKNSCEALGTQGNVKIYEGAPNIKYSDFIIEDNGPGIENQFIDEIFKPFFTTKKEGEGTGLGLHLCHSLMQKMSGELIYDKNFKSGARFVLRFFKNE